MANDTDRDIRRFLRSTSAAMAPDETLRARPGALIGVSTAAESALAMIDIHSIFDLAVSRVFAAAAALVAIERNPTAVEARLNVVASDVAQMPAGVPVRELANQPISILTAIGETAAPALAEALDVATVRDLALWPPYDVAKAILGAAFFPEQPQCFDSEAPSDLLPKSGAYPTERIFFKKLVIDAVPEPSEGAHPIEQAPPIDLATALAAPVGFGRLATGALLTFSQSWFSQGLTLGQLLHSTSLAPGESTRMAVVDWTRRSRAAASEDISESELLSNTMSHSRSLSEVTNATAREFQSGQSSTRTESTAEQAGGGFGLDLGPIAIGGSGGVSTNTTEVMSASSSFGARDLAASYAQDINDRSQQNASSVRNRRASIVREVSQSEHEAISTRCVTNYNHMHALSIHYYEVVQAFRTTTQLERAERCLFVPVKLVDFGDVATVDRWRLVLAGAALSERARRQLTVEYGVVEIIPQTPRITPHRVIVSGGFDVPSSTLAGVKAIARLSSAADGGTNVPANEPPAPPTPPAAPPPATPPTQPAVPPITANAPATLLALKGWNLEQLNRIGWATGRVLMQAGSDSVFVSDDAVVVGFSLREGQAARFVVRLHTGEEITPSAATATAFSFAVPLPITTLESIAVQFTAQQDLSTALILHLNMFGTVMPLDVPIVLKPMSVPREVVKFGSVAGARELIDHLEANRLHYTQAILRALDAATVAALLARFTYRGLPLGQLVDPQPIAVMANFLVFKMNVATGGEADDPRWVEEQQAWQAWLERRGLARPAPRTEIIPIPSGGLFAEAVLGRYNAAEKTDLTRFWNWQDSPIPLSAPEIAPLQAASRAQSEEIRPGQLSAPVLTIQSPTALPDPTGIAAIITALQSGNMFRDMSGMAQTAALAQAALQASAQGATAVGEQAAQNLKTVVENTTERMRIAAAVATGGASGLAGGGGGSRPAKNVTEEGARLNFARDLDQRAASGSTGGAGKVKASNGIAGQLFKRQTGGAVEDLATNLSKAGLDSAGNGDLAQLASLHSDPVTAAMWFTPSYELAKELWQQLSGTALDLGQVADTLERSLFGRDDAAVKLSRAGSPIRGLRDSQIYRASNVLIFIAKASVDTDGRVDPGTDPDHRPNTSFTVRNAAGAQIALDAMSDNYIVLNRDIVRDTPGVRAGDFVLVRNNSNGRVSPAIFGDFQPGPSAGEISFALANSLGYGLDPRTAGQVDADPTDTPGALYIVFTHTTRARQDSEVSDASLATEAENLVREQLNTYLSYLISRAEKEARSVVGGPGSDFA